MRKPRLSRRIAAESAVAAAKRRAVPKKAHRNLAKSSVHPVPLKKFAPKKEPQVKASFKPRPSRSGPIKGRAKVVASRRYAAPDGVKDKDKVKGKTRPEKRAPNERGGEMTSGRSRPDRASDQGRKKRSSPTAAKGKGARARATTSARR